MKRALSGVLLLVAVSVVVGYVVQSAWPLLRPGVASAVRVPARSERPTTGEPAAVAVYAERARFQLAVYFLPEPTADPQATLTRLLPAFPSLQLASKEHGEGTVSVAPLDIHSYAPPSAQVLKHSGVGLSDLQVEELQQSKSVFGLDFSYRPSNGFAVVREAHLLLLQLARETRGLIWDEETRQCFAPDSWETKRLDGWKGGLPNLPAHFTIHFYRNGEFLRAISLGLAKFGLPDVVVNDLVASNSRPIQSLINLTCQTLGEKGRLGAPGKLSVDVRALKDASLRDALVRSYLKGATGQADLTLANGKHEEGDAENRLYEIVFPRAAEVQLQEAQAALISSLFGATDAITYVKHDSELLEASRRAKAKLPSLASRFRKGLDPGERLLLKAPFKTDSGGTEWMWVEVVRWKGDDVEGVLQNDPFEVSGMKAGARVRFGQAVVFDLLHELPDGRIEGNETGEIMRRREESRSAPEPNGTPRAGEPPSSASSSRT